MNLTDICLNISNGQFKTDIDQVLQRAEGAGVSRIVAVGTDVNSSRICAEWADQREQLFATAGVHPHDADAVSESWLTDLRTIARRERVVAIGETGLDYFHQSGDLEWQRERFCTHIHANI